MLVAAVGCFPLLSKMACQDLSADPTPLRQALSVPAPTDKIPVGLTAVRWLRYLDVQ